VSVKKVKYLTQKPSKNKFKNIHLIVFIKKDVKDAFYREEHEA